MNFQEDTLMGMETYKDVHRWYEKAHQALERIDYINEVHRKAETQKSMASEC
jgi:hypothetical protein